MDYDQKYGWHGNEWQNKWHGLWFIKLMRWKKLDKYLTFRAA